MMSQTEQKTIVIWKFGQLIEHYMSIFFEKSYIKCVGVTTPRPFYKNLKLSISLDQLSKMFYGLFLCMSKSRST